MYFLSYLSVSLLLDTHITEITESVTMANDVAKEELPREFIASFNLWGVEKPAL